MQSRHGIAWAAALTLVALVPSCASAGSADDDARAACENLSSSSIASPPADSGTEDITAETYQDVSDGLANRGRDAARAASQDSRYEDLSKTFSKAVVLASTAAQQITAAGGDIHNFPSEAAAEANNKTRGQVSAALQEIAADCDIVNAG